MLNRSKGFATAARIILFMVLLALLAVALYVIFWTPTGQRLREDPHKVGAEFHHWVREHRVIAPLIFLGLYLIVAVCLLPVWWLQILAGYGFGLWWGIVYSLAGATLGAGLTYLISKTLLSEWVHTKFEARHAKLREIDEKMGHNGLLIVMACRLMHFLPFGVANYLFGLSLITLADVVLGTLLGNAPIIIFYVCSGAGLYPWKNPMIMTSLAGLNVLLLVPVILRYVKPQWFKKIGVE